jgi:hypothetical protein
MKTLALAFAAVVCVSAPALAGSATTQVDKPIVLAQSMTVISRDRGPSVTIRTGDRDRWERRRHRHYMARDRGCRTVTIRERRGDQVIIKKIRRC